MVEFFQAVIRSFSGFKGLLDRIFMWTNDTGEPQGDTNHEPLLPFNTFHGIPRVPPPPKCQPQPN